MSALKRQYRLMAVVLLLGVISAGHLAMEHCTAAMRSTIAWYYGVEPSQTPHSSAPLIHSLTMAQGVICLLAVVGFAYFVLSETFRVRRMRPLAEVSNGPRTEWCRLDRASLLRMLLQRSLVFAGILLLLYGFQEAYERSTVQTPLAFSGSYSWHELLPLATVTSIALVVAAVAAVISTVGLRLVRALWSRIESNKALRANAAKRRVARRAWPSDERTFRERFGSGILSRPPPLRCRISAPKVAIA